MRSLALALALYGLGLTTLLSGPGFLMKNEWVSSSVLGEPWLAPLPGRGRDLFSSMSSFRPFGCGCVVALCLIDLAVSRAGSQCLPHLIHLAPLGMIRGAALSSGEDETRIFTLGIS